MPGKARLIKGSNRESVLAPLWRDNTSLYVATDWTGWWNIYQIGLRGEPPQALYPADEEFADALWELGARPFAMLGDGRLAVRHGRGSARLGLLDPETSELTDLDLPFTEFLDGRLGGRHHDRGDRGRAAGVELRGQDRRETGTADGAAGRDQRPAGPAATCRSRGRWSSRARTAGSCTRSSTRRRTPR